MEWERRVWELSPVIAKQGDYGGRSQIDGMQTPRFAQAANLRNNSNTCSTSSIPHDLALRSLGVVKEVVPSEVSAPISDDDKRRANRAGRRPTRGRYNHSVTSVSYALRHLCAFERFFCVVRTKDAKHVIII